ncbi:hypothetical protein [Pseudoalteromonas xiamenensis]
MTEARQQLLSLQLQLQTRLEKVRTDLKRLTSADSQEQAQQRENDEVLQELEKHLSDELDLVAFLRLHEKPQVNTGIAVLVVTILQRND